MANPSHIFCATHQSGENLVVVLATAQVPRDAMRQLGSGGIGICFQKSNGGHNEAGHTERALEALFVNDTLLHRMQFPVGARQSFDSQNLPVAYRMCENRASVVRYIVNEDRA